MRWVALLAACGSAAAPPIENQGGGHGTGMLELRELVALGFTAKRAEMGSLLCRGRTCICAEPLECETCRLADALESAAGADSQPGVTCQAQTGVLCGLDYVVGPSGDGIAFYSRGVLIGSVGAGEDGYCETRPTWLMFGRVPDCDEPARDVRSLCGVGALPPRPIESPKALFLLP